MTVCVQEVFNKVIKARYYPKNNEIATSRNYMCNALWRAYIDGIISVEEARAASVSIETYLHNITGSQLGTTLRKVLTIATGKYYEQEELLGVYKDWANRPFAEEDKP